MKQQKEQKQKGKLTQKARAKQVGIAATSIIALSTASSIAAIALNEKPNSSTPQNNSVAAKRNNDPTTTTNAVNAVKSSASDAPGGFFDTLWPKFQKVATDASFLRYGDKWLDDLLKTFSIANKQTGVWAQGSGNDFTLHMSSGLQNHLDGLFIGLSNNYKTLGNKLIDVNDFKQHFKYYYTIGDDKTEYEMRIGENNWRISGLVDPKTNRLKDINIFAKFVGTGVDWIDNTGAKFVIAGGDNPSPVLQSLDDIGTYAPSLAGLSKQRGLIASFARTDNQHNNPKVAEGFSIWLKSQIEKVASEAHFTGTTKQLTVSLNLSTPTLSTEYETKVFLNGYVGNGGNPDWNQWFPGLDQTDVYDNYKNSLPIEFYYSVGNNKTLTKVSGTTFNIDLSNTIDYSGQTPKIPKIHFYYASHYLENDGAKFVGAIDKKNWPDVDDSEISKTEFKYLGEEVIIDPYDTDPNNIWPDRLKDVKDIINTVEAPTPKNDGDSANRTVDVKIQQGALHNEDLLEYSYRIFGSNQSFLPKDQFFGAGNPGSTNEAISKGVEWRATRKPFSAFDPQVKIPADPGTQKTSDSWVEGKLLFNVPTVSTIDKPVISATNSKQWFITTANRNGIDYEFTLPNGKLWPNNKTTATADELDKWHANGSDMLNLYNPSTGKFDDVLWTATPINKASAAKPTNGKLSITTDDKPSSSVHAILENIDRVLAPKVDQNSKNTSEIKIILTPNNPINWNYSLNGKPLKLDNNNILVDINGAKINTWNGTSASSNISYELDKQQPIKTGAFVEFNKQVSVAANLSTSRVPNYIDNIAGLPTVEGNSIEFNFKTNNFPINSVDLEYSIDGKNWYSETDFKDTKNNPNNQDDKFYSSVFNGTRNLHDGSAFRTLKFRTKVNGSSNFIIDKQVAAANNLVEDPTKPGMYIGEIDTTHLKIAFDTTPFLDSKNQPILDGTNASDYTITAPTLPGVTYKFKVKGEDDSKFLEAGPFKTAHPNISTTTTNGKHEVQKIEWRAEVDSNHEFVDFSSKVQGLIINHIFKSQELKPKKDLAAIVTHKIAAPKLVSVDQNGNPSNSNVFRSDYVGFDIAQLTSDPVVTYQYRIGGTGGWTNITQARLDSDSLINPTKDGFKTLEWRVVFADPDINKIDPSSQENGTIDTSKLLIAIPHVANLPLSIFSGNDTLHWTFDDTNNVLSSQMGVAFEFRISGLNGLGNSQKSLTPSELHAAQGTINLYDQNMGQLKDIIVAVKPSDKDRYIITDNNGSWTQTIHTTNLKRYIESVGTPTITGNFSNQYTINENAAVNQSKDVEIKYSVDLANWYLWPEFHSKYTNLFDEINNKNTAYDVHWRPYAKGATDLQPLVSTNAVIDSQFTGGQLTLPANMKLVTENIDIPSFDSASTSTTDYSLPKTLGHMNYTYKIDGDANYVDADAFKIAHPNIFDFDNNLIYTIHWNATPVSGYAPAPGVKTDGDVTGADTLKKVVPADKIVTPVTRANAGKTTAFDLDTKNNNVLEYVYSTDDKADPKSFVPLNTLIANEGGNLYDSATGHLKSLYFIAVLRDKNNYELAAQTAKPVDISALKKVITAFNAPSITSPTNSSNDYDLTLSPTKNVKYTFTTGAISTEDFKKIKDAIGDNLYDGSDLTSNNGEGFKTIIWKVEPLDNTFEIVPTTGPLMTTSHFDEIKGFKKVITDPSWITNSAPTYKDGGISTYTFNEPSFTGLTFKYYVGSDALKAKVFADFQKDTKTLWDSASNQPVELHWIVSPTPGATTPNVYEIPTTISGIINLDVLKNNVISDAKAPVLDHSTKNSLSPIINIDNNTADVKTEFSLGTKTGLTLKELLDEIKNNHNDNLWDEATKQFLDIGWTISPVISGKEFETGTVTSGKLDYNVDGKLIDKYVTTSAPTVTAASTRLQDFIAPNEDTIHFDYTYGLDANEKAKGWAAFLAAHPNFNLYDAKNPNTAVKSIYWEATPKAGYDSGTNNHGTLTFTAPKWVDYVEDVKLGGSASDDYNIVIGTTQGVTYKISDSQTGGTWFTPSDFEHANTNIAGKTLWYQVTSNDTTQYKIDPSIATKQIPITFKNAVGAVVVPTLDPAKTKSNNWAILTSAFTPNLTYKFQISGDNNWYTTTELATHLNELYDSKEDKFNTLSYEITITDPNTYTWPKGYVTPNQPLNNTGTITVDGVLTKVVTSVIAPQLDWAGTTEHASDNFAVKEETKSVDYLFTVDDKTWISAAQLQGTNLYDSKTGQLKVLKYKATPKTGYESTQAEWTDVVDLKGITTYMIDSVEDATLKAGGKTTSYDFAAPTPNVTYYFFDAHGSQDAQTIADFKNSHKNLYNTTDWKLDSVTFGVEPIATTSGITYKLKNIANTKTSLKTSSAKTLDLTGITKVIDIDVPAPSHSGLTGSHKEEAITPQGLNDAVEYKYRMAGTNGAYGTYGALPTDFMINGQNTAVEWQATAKADYEIDSTKTSTGTLPLLPSALGIYEKDFVAPDITFTNTDSYVLKTGTATTPNVIYEFRIEGDTQWKTFAQFGNPNLFDKTTGNVKNIEWRATPATTSTGTFHWEDETTHQTINHFPTKNITDKINAQSVDKFLETVTAPTLVNASANSTDIDLTEPAIDSKYVTYTYKIDGGQDLTLAQLKDAYGKIDWDQANANGTITWTATAKNGYVIATNQGGGTIDTSSIKKIVNAATPAFTSTSISTSDYSIETATHNGLTYYISTDGGKTKVKLSDFLANKPALFNVDNGLKTLEWSVEADSQHNFALPANFTDHGNLTIPQTLTRIVDKIINPTMTGTKTKGYNFSVDAKIDPYVEFKYSLLPSDATPKALADFLKDNTNIWDSTNDSNKTIYIYPSAKTHAEFAGGVSTSVIPVDTSSLIKVIETISAPTIDVTTPVANTKSYNLTSTQLGVDFKYSTDGTTWEDPATFKGKNLYHKDASGAWVTDTIHWQATAKADHEITAATTGTIDTQAMVKFIESLPSISATGDTKTFSEVVTGTTDVPTIPGITYEYYLGNEEADTTKHYATLSDLIAAHPNLNLFNSAKGRTESTIKWSATLAATGYALAPNIQLNGDVTTTNLTNVLEIDPNWVPKTGSGDDWTHWSLSVTSTPAWESLVDYVYSYDTPGATDADWSNYTDFHAAHANLAPDNKAHQIIYKINIKDKTHYKFETSPLEQGTVKLPFSTIITKLDAPVVELINGAASSVSVGMHASTPDVTYEYSLDPNGSFEEWSKFSQSHYNLYDWKTNDFKTLYWKAHVTNTHTHSIAGTIDTGVNKPGTVELKNSAIDITKVLDDFVKPVLSATDSLTYDLVDPSGQPLSTGLTYKLVIGNEEGTPAELIAKSINIYDVVSNTDKTVSWKVVNKDGYVLGGVLDHGSLTIPNGMKNVIDSVTAPVFKNNGDSEHWTFTETNASTDVVFKYSIDGKNYNTLAVLQSILSTTFNNLWNNTTDKLYDITWKVDANNLTKYSFKSGMTTNGSITLPADLIKVIDSVSKPTIPADSESIGYSFNEPTHNVKYEYSIDGTNYFSQTDLPSVLPNIYDETTGQLKVIYYRITPADKTFSLAQRATPTTGKVDTTTVTKWIITSVSPATINGTTTVNYGFAIPPKPGLVYTFSTDENGIYEDETTFRTHHHNLYSTITGLEKVWWKAEPADASHIIKTGVKNSGQIDLSALTRIIDTRVEAPKVDPNSSTNNWSMTAPTADWIKSFVYWTDNDTQERTLADFHALYADITNLKTSNISIHYKALSASNYEFATPDLAQGVFDFNDWKTVFVTDIDLTKLRFEVTSDHKYQLVSDDPSVTDINNILAIPEHFHLEFAWGDNPTTFIHNDATGFNEVQKTFAQKIEPDEFWDNSTQANGDKGAWKHGGSVTFKLVPNNANDNVLATNGVLEKTIDFNADKLKKVVVNYPITINDEQHNPGHDAHFEYVAKYTDKWHEDTNKVDIQLKVGTPSTDASGKITYTPSVSSVQADGSDSLLPILNSWIENRQNNVHITVNPFATLSQQDVDKLIDSITPEKLAEVKAEHPNLIANGENLASLKAKFQKLQLDVDTAKQFFLLVNDIWDGANWRIKEIEIKPVAESDDFILVDEDSRVVWDENSNTIAKVTDDSELIQHLKDAIKPAKDAGSLHDSVIWGDISEIQKLTLEAKSQNLLIRLASYNDGEQPVWYDLKDVNDPEDFFNKVKSISKVHTERRLSAQIISTATDAATGKLVKLTHEEVLNITGDSKIQKVKTRVTSQDYKTESIRITGYTNPGIKDHKIEIDDSVVKENYLLVTYSIPKFPNQWFEKDDLLKKIAELQSDKTPDGKPKVPEYVYGKDITAKIDVKPDWKEKYSLGSIISGPIDYSTLYTNHDVRHWDTGEKDSSGAQIYADYVDALENDITLDGTPNSKKGTNDPSANAKTIYIALDNSKLTAPAFTNNFGIQYKINTSDPKNDKWELFVPGTTNLALDLDKNILADHEAGKYMAVNMGEHDEIQFRIIPIATAGNPGDIVITEKEGNLKEDELFHRTRVHISDWNKDEGTIVKRDTTKLLSIGENELVKKINENFNNSLKNTIQQNNTWLAPFLALVTSSPRYENIEDIKFDPGLFFDGKLIDFTSEAKVKSQILPILGQGFVDEIEKAINDLTGKGWVNGTTFAPNIAIAAKLFGTIDNPTNTVALNKIYALDNTNKNNLFFNRDLLQSNVASFEISQIGMGTSSGDEWGKAFTLSNTIFFGTNAIRFNISENIATNENEIKDAYLVAEDKNTPERIAKIHVFTQYSLSQMSLVLELQNGQIVTLRKSIDGNSKQENIQFARLQPHNATQDSFGDVVQNGANWIYASESLIEKDIKNVVTAGYESPEALKDIALNQDTLVKTIKHWVAKQAELDVNTKTNHIPFEASLFDNNPHSSKSSDITTLTGTDANTIILTTIQPDPAALGTSQAQDIYANEKGDLSVIFGNGKPSIAAHPQNAVAPKVGTPPTVVNFETAEHFKDSNNYVEQQLFEAQASDPDINQINVGYMVVVDSPNEKGEVRYRWLSQSYKQTTADTETLHVAQKPKNDSIPAWGIALAAVGSAIAAGGLGYLIYNRYITKKASKKKRSRISIRKSKT